MILPLDELKAEGFADGFAQAKAEAKAEAKAQAKAKAKADVLLRQLYLRFGDVAPNLVERVRGATSDEHDAMADRMITAPTAIEVVG